MKPKFMILSLVLTASVNAQASSFQWTPIAELNGQPAIGVDYTRSFGPDSMPVIFWNDFTFGHMRSTERPSNRPMTIYRSKFDCKNRMVMNQYNLQTEVKHFHDPNPQQYEQPWHGPGKWYVPGIGSSHEFVMNFFCNNQ